MNRIDVQEIENIIIKVSENQILPRFRNLSKGDVEEKDSPDDIVTIADKEAELELKREILKLHPDAEFIGEESSYANPEDLAKLSHDKPVWVIDPLDGTTNFKNGIEKFGVIVSYIYKEKILYGWIYNPITKMMISAEKGSGAWCAGKKLHVSTAQDIGSTSAVLSLQFFSPERANEIRKRAESVLQWKNNFGSVAIDYQNIVTTDTHFSLFGFIRVWDHAAGLLIHREAGGYSAKFDGSPYNPKDTEGGLILSPSKELWDEFNILILQEN